MASAAVLLALPGLSKGYYQDYCGILKGSGNWCGASGAHSWDYNSGNSYSPPTWTCERIWDPSVGFPIEQECAYQTVWGPDVYRTCVCYGAHVAQFSGRNLEVWGYAEA